MEFKTTINCGGCITKVKPHLDKLLGEENWKVNTENPDKILSVLTDKHEAKEISDLLMKCGYKAEII